jgi:hypothetical protein
MTSHNELRSLNSEENARKYDIFGVVLFTCTSLEESWLL